MGIAVKFLSPKLSARYLMFYSQITENAGVPTQYFIAHEIFKDLTAIVTHGVRDVPDIQLSDEAIVDLLMTKEDAHQGIEVKFITWTYANFYKAIKAAEKRKQLRYLLIILSPTLRILYHRNTMFNKLNEGILSVVVILMDTVEVEPQKLWKEVQSKLHEQLAEDEELVAFPGNIYDAFMFEKMKEFDNQFIELKKDQQNVQQDVQNVQQDVQNVQQDVQNVQQDVQNVQQDVQKLHQKFDTLLKLLSEKASKD